MRHIYLYRKGELAPDEAELPQEFPLRLMVNGREIVTLVASPHELNFLVAGFLWLQGFVGDVKDFLALSICPESGIASVQVRRPLPEQLKPVLTSGCGTGVSFSLPKAQRKKMRRADLGERFYPEALFSAMDKLAGRARGYKLHGGIHSAALAAPDGTLLLVAEDIGRHNTLDRLAGEALLKGSDVAGSMLITSGRISSEMAAKAAMLRVPLIASRTSPTDMARQICATAGITLVGYLRGKTFSIYSHEERIRLIREEQHPAPPTLDS
jgi:FdhD protein